MNIKEKSDGNAEFGQQYLLRLLDPSQMSLIII